MSVPQMPDIVSQDLDKSATLKYQHQITGEIESLLEISCSEPSLSDLRVHCTTEEANFLPFNIIKLVIFGLANVNGDVLVLEKESPDAWKQTSVAEM